MEPKSSVPYSQESTTGFDPELVYSSPHIQTLCLKFFLILTFRLFLCFQMASSLHILRLKCQSSIRSPFPDLWNISLSSHPIVLLHRSRASHNGQHNYSAMKQPVIQSLSEMRFCPVSEKKTKTAPCFESWIDSSLQVTTIMTMTQKPTCMGGSIVGLYRTN